jgi:uncharacterized protein (DUF2236 family)
LIESALMAHDLVLPAVRAQERELYYAESRRFAALFGVPASALPSDWAGFATYCEAMRRPHARSPWATQRAPSPPRYSPVPASGCAPPAGTGP